MNNVNFLFGTSGMNDMEITTLEEQLKDKNIKIKGSHKSKATEAIIKKLKKFYYIHMYKHIQIGNLEEYKEAVNEKINDMESKKIKNYNNATENIIKIAEDDLPNAADILDSKIKARDEDMLSADKKINDYKEATDRFAYYIESKQKSDVQKDIDSSKEITSNLMKELEEQRAKDVNKISDEKKEAKEEPKDESKTENPKDNPKKSTDLNNISNIKSEMMNEIEAIIDKRIKDLSIEWIKESEEKLVQALKKQEEATKEITIKALEKQKEKDREEAIKNIEEKDNMIKERDKKIAELEAKLALKEKESEEKDKTIAAFQPLQETFDAMLRQRMSEQPVQTVDEQAKTK